MLSQSDIHDVNERFMKAPSDDVLRWTWDRFGDRAVIGTSFQGSGLVMIHLAQLHDLPFPVFTLDTGLLFPETVALRSRLEQFFGISIESLEPDVTVEAQGEAQGPELWARDPDLCCTIRKVLPLQDKLSDLDCWMTGLRRQQSDARSNVDVVEVYIFDEATGREIVKVNPMAHWSRDAIWKYIRDQQIPYNPLHDQGYRSIGCSPCTQKALGNQKEERAGRWTGFKKVECGIHTFMSKKVDFQI